MSTAAETLPASWRFTAAAARWVFYVPIAAILWSKIHLPLFFTAILLLLTFLFLAVPLVIFVLRAPRASYVGLCLVVLTHYLVLFLALTVFSVVEWAFHGARYGAVATALASATAFVAILLTRHGRTVVDFSIGRLLLKFRLWTFAEVFLLSAGIRTKKARMINFLVTSITALGVIYTFVALGLTYFKSRLPFRQAIVRRTELARTSPKTRLIVYHVYFDWPAEKSWVSAIGFLFGTRDPGKVVNSNRYARLSSFYSAGRIFRLHYVPGLEWLFPPIAETPFLQAQTVLLIILGVASPPVLYLLLSGSVRF